MPEKETSNEEFFKKYEAYEKETIEDFIKRYRPTESELREAIAYIIECRQMIRVVEIERLEAESANLLKKMKKTILKKCLRKLDFSRKFSLFRNCPPPPDPGQG